MRTSNISKFLIVLASVSSIGVQAGTVYWDGGGVDNNWNTSANWWGGSWDPSLTIEGFTPAGGATGNGVTFSFTGVSGTGGTGTGATFNVQRSATSPYAVTTVTLASGGTGYSVSDVITLAAASIDGVDDLLITVNTLVKAADAGGTVPAAADSVLFDYLTTDPVVNLNAPVTIQKLVGETSLAGNLEIGSTAVPANALTVSITTANADTIINASDNGVLMDLSAPVIISGTKIQWIKAGNNAADILRFSGPLTLDAALETRDYGTVNGAIQFSGPLKGSSELRINSGASGTVCSFEPGHDSTTFAGALTFRGAGIRTLDINAGPGKVLNSTRQILNPAANVDAVLNLNTPNAINHASIRNIPSADMLIDANASQETMGYLEADGPLVIDVTDLDPLSGDVLWFADSSANAWSGTVTVVGFSPKSIRFGTSATALTAAQLAAFVDGYTLDVDGYLVSTTPPVVPKTVNWDNGGVGNDWLTAANWADNAVPNDIDTAQFTPLSINGFSFSVTTSPNAQFLSEDGVTYQLEKSTDLTAESWTDVAGAFVVGDGAVKTLSDPAGNPLSGQKAFYRVYTSRRAVSLGGSVTHAEVILRGDTDFSFDGPGTLTLAVPANANSIHHQGSGIAEFNVATTFESPTNGIAWLSANAGTTLRFNGAMTLVDSIETRGDGTVEFDCTMSGSGSIRVNNSGTVFGTGHDSSALPSIVWILNSNLTVNAGTVLSPFDPVLLTGGKLQINDTNGTLTLNAANAMNGPAINYAATGGKSLTINLNASQDNLGILFLGNNTLTINIANGSTIAFPKCSGVAWDNGLGGNGTVTITNFAEGAVRFGTDNTGLTAAQLLQINGGAYTLDANGYLTAL